MLDALMPEKLKIKAAPAIVDDVLLADGAKARLSAEMAIVLKDAAPDWRGTCPICLDLLPVECSRQIFYECCCKMFCNDCNDKCRQHDLRCPLCRALPHKSDAEWLRRMQKHVDKGNAEAQNILGMQYRDGGVGLQQSFLRSVKLFELAAAQGLADAQNNMGSSNADGQGVEVDRKTAEQGFPIAQYNLGTVFYNGRGVAQSHDEAVKWWRLAAAQGVKEAPFNLAACHAHGHGVLRDFDEALRLYECAAAEGCAEAAPPALRLAALCAEAPAADGLASLAGRPEAASG